MNGMSDERRTEMLRWLAVRRGDVLFDLSHTKLAQARLERELIEIEDAMQDLESSAITDDKGTIG